MLEIIEVLSDVDSDYLSRAIKELGEIQQILSDLNNKLEAREND